jgi:Domain of unknown function (DUF4360)
MKLSFIAAFVLLSWRALAGDLEIQDPTYGGSGCPAGSAAISVAPDQKSLSVLFDQFATSAGGTTGKVRDRKACALTIPVKVPQGFSVAIFQVDYRGFNIIPKGGVNRFEAEYFWAGSQGPKVSRYYYGPEEDSFYTGDTLAARTLVWTACGESVNFRINASMLSTTNSKREQIEGIIDSVDVDAGIKYHLTWRKCK